MIMRKEVFSVTLLLMAMTAMTAPNPESHIRVQPGQVKVKQGNNVSLWCQFNNKSQNGIPVHWQSPPNFITRTSNCQTFGPSFQKKYIMSCAKSDITWYNMTITDVRWVDRGKYRCIHVWQHGIVDLQVSVPVTDVSMTSNSPLFLSMDHIAVFNCRTNCAYPAPTISWFINGQPFNGSAAVTTTEFGCTEEKEGQKQTISSVSVIGKYVHKEKQVSIVSCTAENSVWEKKISKTRVITYYDPCEHVRCHLGRVCQATSKDQGVCVCGSSDLCNDYHKQVCGDDGILYSSLCELNRTACIKDKHIGVDRANETCKAKVTPSPLQPYIDVAVTFAALFGVVSIAVAIALITWVLRKRRLPNVRETASKRRFERSETEMTEKNNLAYSASKGNLSDIEDPVMRVRQEPTKQNIYEDTKETYFKQHFGPSGDEMYENNGDAYSTITENQSVITENPVMGVGQKSTKPNIYKNIKETDFKQHSGPSGDEMYENNDACSTITETQSDIGDNPAMRTGLSTSARVGQVDSGRTDSSRNSETPMLRSSTDSNGPTGSQGSRDPVILSAHGMMGGYKTMGNRLSDDVADS